MRASSEVVELSQSTHTSTLNTSIGLRAQCT